VIGEGHIDIVCARHRRDLFERVDVDSRELKAGAVWNMTTDQGVNWSDAASEWLRRAGAGRVLNRLGTATDEIPLPYPVRSREWLRAALVECVRCEQVVERTSPIQRYCPDCAAALGRERSRESVRRRRRAL